MAELASPKECSRQREMGTWGIFKEKNIKRQEEFWLSDQQS